MPERVPFQDAVKVLEQRIATLEKENARLQAALAERGSK